MKCSKCGKEIANDSLFCEYCGASTEKKDRDCKKEHLYLLIAMLITTFAMWEVCAFLKTSVDWELYSTGLIPLTIATSFFIITLRKAIKKAVSIPYFLLFLLLLIANSVMEIALLNPEIEYKTHAAVNYNSKGYEDYIYIYTLHRSSDPPHVKEQNDYWIKSHRDDIIKAFKASGICECGVGETYTTKSYYASRSDDFLTILVIICGLFILCALYIIIAHYKKMKQLKSQSL